MVHQVRRMPLWLQNALEELLKPPVFLQQNNPKDAAKHSPAPLNTQILTRRFRPVRPQFEGRGYSPRADGTHESERSQTHDRAMSVKRKQLPLRKPPKRRQTIRHAANLAVDVTAARRRGKQTVPPGLERRYVALLKQVDMPTSLFGCYDWEITDLERVADILRVTTKTGTYALKRTHISPDRINFLYDVCDHIRNNGFHRFSAFAMTKDRQPYVIQDGEAYYATHWIAGNTANYASTQQLGQIAYALAQFHEASKGFSKHGRVAPSAFRLSTMSRHRTSELRQILAEAERKEEKDEFDNTLLRMGAGMKRDADKSLRLLESQDCKTFLRNDEQDPGLCHLDVIPSNFVYDGQKQVHLLDLDLAAFAPRALDLAHLLRRGLQLNWSSEVAYACFLHYNVVRAMETAEYVVVQALLTFPYRAWRLAHTRYRVFAEDTQISDLRECDLQEERRQAFLEAYAKQVTRQTSE